MKLLFRRSQTTGRVLAVQFQLWGKIDLQNDEAEIIDKFRLGEAVLIGVPQDKLIRNSIIAGVLGAIAAYVVLSMIGLGYPVLAILAGGGAGYYYYHQKRETIFVKDLMHGRYFSCNSVIDLARKEKWLSDMTAIFRQVMETAKHWGGTETNDIPVLDKEAARLLIARL